MKIDSEPVICHSTITNKTDSKHYPLTADTKAFETKENILDSAGLKEREGIFKGNQKRVDFDYDNNETNDDPVLKVGNDIDGWPLAKLGGSMRVEDITNDNEKGVSQFIKSNSLSSEDESEQKDSVFYMDKSVMECDLPELVVCYKESTYHVVKDICIDEGAPVQDKFLFDNGADETNVWDFVPSERDQECKTLKEKQDTKTDMHEASVLSGETELGWGNSDQYDSSDFMHTVEWKNRDVKNVGAENDDITEKILEEKDEASKEVPTLAELLLMPELSMENCDSRSFDNDRNGIYQKSLQNGRMELILASPALVSGDKESDNDKEEEILVSSQASAPAENTTVHEENSRTCSNKLSHSSEESSSNGQCILNDLQHTQGETSFSAAGPMSGLVSYSGAIAYSGSLSMRSDSSTTSARSFAFPILQSEWNSSPVRMAKADRSHFRRHRWRQTLLCCRF